MIIIRNLIDVLWAHKLEKYKRFIFLALGSGNDNVKGYRYMEIFGDCEIILIFRGNIIQFLTPNFTKCPFTVTPRVYKLGISAVPTEAKEKWQLVTTQFLDRFQQKPIHHAEESLMTCSRISEAAEGS